MRQLAPSAAILVAAVVNATALSVGLLGTLEFPDVFGVDFVVEDLMAGSRVLPEACQAYGVLQRVYEKRSETWGAWRVPFWPQNSARNAPSVVILTGKTCFCTFTHQVVQVRFQAEPSNFMKNSFILATHRTVLPLRHEGQRVFGRINITHVRFVESSSTAVALIDAECQQQLEPTFEKS